MVAKEEYLFYRKGRVSPASKSLNTVLLALLVGACGSGAFSLALFGALRWAGVALLDWGRLAHVAPVVLGCAAFSAAAYYYGCASLEHRFYTLRRGDAAAWKCKPTQWLAPERHAEEVRWGTLNAAYTRKRGRRR